MKRFETRVDPRTGQQYLAVYARGAALKDDPVLNKGTCFTRDEREQLGLLGLLPPSVQTPDEQIGRAYGNYLKAGDDVRRYLFLAGLHPNLAISLLQEHLHDVPDGSPVPWMLLLDLLLREGDEQGYVKASAECRRHFNVNFSVHPIPREQEGNHRGLEAYPHILDMLSQAWSTPEIEKVFKDLIYDQRDGVRMGFEPEAYRDILLLRSIAQEKTLQPAV